MADAIVPNIVVSMPSQLFTMARSFKAASNGKIYIGKIDTDPTILENQIQVYAEDEDGSYVPMAQPITINHGGFPVYNGQITKFVTIEGHSMAVYDSFNVQQFYFPNILKYSPDSFLQRLNCRDIATLRTTEPVIASQRIYVVEYYSGGVIGGGLYQYDESDKITPDDGITCIVTTNGARFKPILSDGKIYASRSGFGIGIDQTEIWKKFCAVEYDKVIDIDIVISGEGVLAAGTSLIAIKDAKITLSASVTDGVTLGSEAHCLVASSNCKVRDVKIDGNAENFFDGAGILTSYANNVEISGCTFVNTSGIAIKLYNSTSVECSKNKIVSCRHGIEGWLATSLKIHDNHVTNISHNKGNNGGGIWFAVCQDVSVYDNYIADCADVGIDFEGGARCYAHNNFVTRCRNGELTVFGTGYQSDLQSAGVVMGDIEFRENRVIRDSYANNRDGTAVNNGLTDVAGEMVYGGLDLVQNGTIRFIRNEIRVIATTGNSLYCHRSRTSDKKGTARIVQDGCVYETVSGCLINWYDRQDREFHNCTLKFIGNAAAIVMGELRDVRTLLSRDIKINIDTTAVVSSYPLTLNNSSQVIAGELELSGWVFRGHAGSYLHIDQTFISRTVTIGNMDFDDAGGMVDLPISIGAGNIRWKNQKFRIKIPTGTMTYSFVKGVFYQSDFTAMNCYIWLSLDSKKKCGYRFALVNDLKDTMYLIALDDHGKVKTGIRPSAICYATFSGNTVNLTQTTDQSLTAIIELNIDSVDY